MSSCISFKGINIPTEMKSYYVADTEVSARNAPAELGQIFSETLRKVVQTQTRLVLDEEDPDIVFTPVITRYVVNAVAPVEGTTVAFNRLDVSTSIDYENFIDDTKSRKLSYNSFQDFESTLNLQDVEFDLIDEIFEEIIDRAFNDTFTDW